MKISERTFNSICIIIIIVSLMIGYILLAGAALLVVGYGFHYFTTTELNSWTETIDNQIVVVREMQDYRTGWSEYEILSPTTN